jgi:hypothetical protein
MPLACRRRTTQRIESTPETTLNAVAEPGCCRTPPPNSRRTARRHQHHRRAPRAREHNQIALSGAKRRNANPTPRLLKEPVPPEEHRRHSSQRGRTSPKLGLQFVGSRVEDFQRELFVVHCTGYREGADKCGQRCYCPFSLRSWSDTRDQLRE